MSCVKGFDLDRARAPGHLTLRLMWECRQEWQHGERESLFHLPALFGA